MEYRDPIIIHQMQTKEKNCVSASLAMVLNSLVDAITEQFDDKYRNQELEIHQYLDECGVTYRRCLADERSLKGDCVYLMTSPSLNIQGCNHMLVVEMLPCGERWYILDPNKGREGRLVYGEDCDLNGWSPQYEFKVEDLLEYWSKPP